MLFSFRSLLVIFESSQLENRRTSPCFPSFPCSQCSPCYPCSPNLIHVLPSGMAGFNNFCSPGWSCGRESLQGKERSKYRCLLLTDHELEPARWTKRWDNVDTMVDSLLDMARGQIKTQETLQTKSVDTVGIVTNGQGVNNI